jgi:FtsH-binding integral membrane protein
MNDNVNYLGPVSEASVEDRSNFIWKCYAHVVGAILVFAGIEAYLLQSGVANSIAVMSQNSPMLFLGAFVLVGWGGTHLAHKLESIQMQYAVFAVFIFIYAVVFSPLLLMATLYAPGMIDTAAGITVLASAGLIATVMITRKDFSFLRGLLVWIGMLAIVGIFGSMIFGFHLGTWFSVAMIGFAGAAILYDTSNIMHHYPQDRYVAASMSLFASIAMMFFYILRLLMSRD